MNKTQKARAIYYGLFTVAVTLVLLGAWLRQATDSTYGLPFIGLFMWLWLRFGDHD